MEELFTINNKKFYKTSTTVLYTSSYNYLKDAVEFINKNALVISIRNPLEASKISRKLLVKFKCQDLAKKDNLTRLDIIKINILEALEKDQEVYVFLNTLTYLDNEFKNTLITYLKENNKIIINYTEDIEEALLLEYIMVLHENKIIMEGNKEEVLKEEKILKKLGLNLPTIVELSNGLKYYGLIDKLYYDNESLVNRLWK